MDEGNGCCSCGAQCANHAKTIELNPRVEVLSLHSNGSCEHRLHDVIIAVPGIGPSLNAVVLSLPDVNGGSDFHHRELDNSETLNAIDLGFSAESLPPEPGIYRCTVHFKFWMGYDREGHRDRMESSWEYVVEESEKILSF